MNLPSIFVGDDAAFSLNTVPTCVTCGKTVTPRMFEFSAYNYSAVYCESCHSAASYKRNGLRVTSSMVQTAYRDAAARLHKTTTQNVMYAALNQDLRGVTSENRESNWVMWAIYNGFTNITNLEYVALEDDSTISYLPREKAIALAERGMMDEKWTHSTRVNPRIGRALRAIVALPFALTDAEVEKAVNIFKANDPRVFADRITIVRGEEIRDAYHERNYAASGTGDLANSCMRYDRCQSYLDIYVKNENQIGLAVARNDDGDLIARALVWTLDNGEGFYLDRVYGTQVAQRAFATWARQNGIVGSAEDITLAHTRFEQYPYCDTYRYLTYDGTISTYENYHTDNVLSETEGGQSAFNVQCYECECSVDNDDVQEVYARGNTRSVCWDCYNEHYVCHAEDCDMHVARGYEYCDDCRAELQCEECGNMADSAEEIYCTDHSRFCESCYNDRCCGRCGEVPRIESASDREHTYHVRGVLSDEFVCESCAVEESEELFGIDATAFFADRERDLQIIATDAAVAQRNAMDFGQMHLDSHICEMIGAQVSRTYREREANGEYLYAYDAVTENLRSIRQSMQRLATWSHGMVNFQEVANRCTTSRGW